MNILALDLGTKTGWCYLTSERMELGTWTLATAKEIRDWGKKRMTRRNDPRVHRLFHLIDRFFTHQKYTPDIFVFEDVQFSSYTLQVQLWSALRAAMWLASRAPTIVECVPVATLKKFATGHGGATKEMMMRAALKADPIRFDSIQGGDEVLGFDSANNPAAFDDNAIDAYHLARWAKHNLSRIKK